jgi:hypothetical protein
MCNILTYLHVEAHLFSHLLATREMEALPCEVAAFEVVAVLEHLEVDLLWQ